MNYIYNLLNYHNLIIETEWWKEDYLAEKTSQLYLDIYLD